jgi:hypothetical protein
VKAEQQEAGLAHLQEVLGSLCLFESAIHLERQGKMTKNITGTEIRTGFILLTSPCFFFELNSLQAVAA